MAKAVNFAGLPASAGNGSALPMPNYGTAGKDFLQMTQVPNLEGPSGAEGTKGFSMPGNKGGQNGGWDPANPSSMPTPAGGQVTHVGVVGVGDVLMGGEVGGWDPSGVNGGGVDDGEAAGMGVRGVTPFNRQNSKSGLGISGY